jgi:hypothetical protein
MRQTHNTAELIRKAAVVSILFLTCPAPHTHAFAPRRAEVAAAQRAARSFFEFHFARDMGFSRRSLSLRRRWLTPELYARLRAGLRKEAKRAKAHPDEAPYINGDPFTDSQLYPNTFRIGKALHTGKRVEIEVTFVWTLDGGAFEMERTVTAFVTGRSGKWLINDIVGENGEGMLSSLPGRPD